MSWSSTYTPENKPDTTEIKSYIGSVLWDELIEFLESELGLKPKVEYSRCSGAPGWNVKYKKSGRSVCTLYPEKDIFTCMISIGRRESDKAELYLSRSTPYLKELYENAGSLNGSRWLMIDVSSQEILDDVKELIYIRINS